MKKEPLGKGPAGLVKPSHRLTDRQARLRAAIGRRLTDFLPLRPGEQQLLDACRLGEIAGLSAQRPEAPNDSNTVRADFLRFLLLGGDADAPVHERGVRLTGAWVEGDLDLDGCKVPCQVGLLRCHFRGLIRAKDARLAGLLALNGSHLSRGMNAERLKVEGSIWLRDDFHSKGAVRLLGAQIGGDLSCTGGYFEVGKGVALSADGMSVKGDVLLRDGFQAKGEVRLLGAQIGGDLSCTGGQFEVQEGNALSADRVDVRGGVFLREGFEAKGEVRLLGAQIGGDLSCTGGQFEVENGDALSADRANVKGDVFLSGGFRANGAVRLPGAQIGGSLDCTGGHFEVGKGVALSADGVNVKGAALLRNGFRAKGEVRLLGAQIGGDLSCTGGQFEVQEGNALSADRVDVRGGVFLCEGFEAKGEVRLLGAQIGSSLDCAGGLFGVETGDALSADGAVVKGDVFLGEGFKAKGQVRLPGAQIGGNLGCIGGHFLVQADVALTLESAEVKGAWLLHRMGAPLRINAGHLSVGILVDELEAWAPGSVLNGFRYAALGGAAPTDGGERETWLRRQSDLDLGLGAGGTGFRPQPWRQIQKVLRDMGHSEDAKQLGIAFEHQRRAIGRIGQSPIGTHAPIAWLKRGVGWLAHWGFGVLAGFGFRPMRLLAWMVGAWLVSAFIYWSLAMPPHGALGPTDPLVFQNNAYAACVAGSNAALEATARGEPNRGNWYLCKELPGEYSTFSPLVYSLDIVLPLVDLGQEKAWGPVIKTPENIWWRELLTWSPGHVVRFIVWLETLFGWISSLLLVAIVSGFARRSEEG